MPERAKVTSLEAIENFRARLIIYRDKAGRVLDEVSDGVVRTRLWLETDRPTHWENQIRRLTQELQQRQQELFSAQLSGLSETSSMQQAAVQKARRAIREAEQKMYAANNWRRQFDHKVEPVAHQVEKLRHTLGHELGKAVARINELIKTLGDYAESAQGHAATMPAPAAVADATEAGAPPAPEESARS